MMDINTTPLIDVMLVLLVMLIITIPIQLHAVNLEMPVGTPPQSKHPAEKVQIDIDEKSTVYWQGLPVFRARVRARTERWNWSRRWRRSGVHIRPNKDCSYAVFANVLSSTNARGSTRWP